MNRFVHIGIVFLSLFCFLKTGAQLCTGSLGDPVVNITFGNGASPGPPLEAGVTSYHYITADCPNDSSYTLRTSTTNCFTTWHTLTSDHTGNEQGYFMLVNASFAPSDFYVQKVTGICSNTTYEFAAWLMNMVRIPGQIRPDITFTVEQLDGTVLGSFTTGAINHTTVPQWKQYGFNFRTPPGIFEVIIRMRNNAPGGVGNDIALDDITFRPCGPSVTTSFGGADSLDVCANEVNDYFLTATVPAVYTDPQYQWQLSKNRGSTWQDILSATSLSYTASPRDTGSYWYRLTLAERENFPFASCRISSGISIINVRPLPVVDAGPDKVIMATDVVTLTGSASVPSTPLWHPTDFLDNPNAFTPRASPAETITYHLLATSPYGCSSQDSIKVHVISGIYIPNSFTPNKDGRNDQWQIKYLEHFPEAEVAVFNRYGNIVFAAKSGRVVSWDGTYKGIDQPVGVYAYLVKVKKGNPFLKGTIVLLR